MLETAWSITIAALKRGAVWSTIIWTFALILALGLVVLLVGLQPLWYSLVHPSLGGAATSVAVLRGALLVGLLALAAGPFWMAGGYGVLASAVREQAPTWDSFWTFAVQNYGRAWGLIGYGIFYVIALIVVGAILVSTLKAVGVVALVAAAVLSLPWVVRMAGGLFVARQSWGASFARSFHGPHYGGLLGGIVLGYAALALTGLILLNLNDALAMLGDLAASVAFPVWLFALYAAEQSPPLQSPGASVEPHD